MNGPLTVFLLFIHSLLLAQGYRLKNYTVKDGLSSNAITALVKDTDGFLWIGTTNGLNRFDGNAFDVFFNRPNSNSSLANNQVQALHIDNHKKLWVGTVGGISLYQPKEQAFKNYYPDSSSGKCGRWFCALITDNEDQLWVGTWYELLVFDTKTETFRRSGWAEFAAKNKPTHGNNSRVVILSLKKKNRDELWILTTYGLYSVNTKTNVFQWYPYEGLNDYFGCQINHIDSLGNLWIGTYNKGIVVFNTTTQAWAKYNPPASWLTAPNFQRCYGITPWDSSSFIYAGVDKLAFFNWQERRFKKQFDTPVADIFQIHQIDRGYWLSGNSGLTRIEAFTDPVRIATPFSKGNYINRLYTISNKPRQIILDQSSKKQTGVLNTETGVFQPFKTKTGNSVGGELSGWLQLDTRYGLFTSEEQMFKVDLETLTASPILMPKKRWDENQYLARNLTYDSKGYVWIRLRGQGIVRYHPSSDKFEWIELTKPEQHHAYAALYYNQQQETLWFAIEHQGLYEYSISSKSIKRHLLPDNSTGAAADITCITGDKQGNMFMTDVNRGLYYYEYASQKFSKFGMESGLPSTSCYFASIDSSNQLWISTANGICRFNIKNRLAETFEDLQSLPIPISFLHLDSNGQIYTCWNNTYYTWQPESLVQPLKQNRLYIRKFQINNQNTVLSDSYTLDYTQTNITLQLGTTATLPVASVQFEYAINDTSRWQAVDKSNTLNFSNLTPGKYELYFRLKGNEGNKKITIKITPPWWQKRSFWLAILLLLMIIGSILIRKRIAFIRSQAQLKQKIAETEMMALRAQMNPHFIFNCISSIDNFILNNDRENASIWLGKFARLIRAILENSKHDVIPFWKEWESLKLYTELEQLRSNDTFTCTMNVDDNLLNGHYRIPSLIIQPFVENAIHHGLRHRNDNKGKLSIIATIHNNQLMFIVEDNGIGRNKSAALKAFNNTNHTSYGMQLSSERIELFNGNKGQITITDLDPTNEQHPGTRVHVLLNV